jgi:hypothetical protein
LNPIKYKAVVAQTSKKLGLSEELIDEVVSYYYKTVSTKIGELSHHTLAIPNLGRFQVKKTSLLKKIEQYKNALGKYEKELANEGSRMSMRSYEAMMGIKSDLEGFERILKMITEEELRKEEKKQEKIKFNSENNESN